MKRLSTTLLIFVLLLILPSREALCLQTQHSTTYSKLTGRITDEVGVLAGGASIKVEGKHFRQKITADENGDYEIMLPSGMYKITVKHSGFRKYRGYILVMNPATATLDIKLKPSGETLHVYE